MLTDWAPLRPDSGRVTGYPEGTALLPACKRHHSGFGRFFPATSLPCVTMIRRHPQDWSMLWISPDAAPSSAVPPERLP